MPEWDNNRTGGGQGNWNSGRDNDRDWGRDGRGGGQDWDRGRRDNDWNRGHGGWDRDWDRHRGRRDWDWDWDDWFKPKKHKRRYNYYLGNPAWWYPYWNQWVAPIINPIVSWFQPYPYGTYPGSAPAIIYP